MMKGAAAHADGTQLHDNNHRFPLALWACRQSSCCCCLNLVLFPHGRLTKPLAKYSAMTLVSFFCLLVRPMCLTTEVSVFAARSCHAAVVDKIHSCCDVRLPRTGLHVHADS